MAGRSVAGPLDKALRAVPLLSVFLFLICYALYAAPCPAATDAVKDNKLESLNKSLRDKRVALEKARKLEKVTLHDIDKLNKELNEVDQRLIKYERVLNSTRQRVDGMRREIHELQVSIDTRREWLKRKLRAMNKYGGFADAILILGSAEDIPDLMRRWKYLEVTAQYEQDMLVRYREELEELKGKKEQLSMMYAKYRREEADVKATADELRGQRDRKQNMLSSVRQEQDSYERMILDIRKSSARMQKVLRETARKKEQEALLGGFKNTRGRLPWPVNGTVAIPYGTQKDPKFKTPVFRNGIYLAAPDRSVAHAVFGGKVVFADWFEGYGQLVIINHGGGYHSLYANLSEIFLSQGDIIKKEDRIGLVGTSGILEQPALYFEIRYMGKPLNPVQWLSKKDK